MFFARWLVLPVMAMVLVLATGCGPKWHVVREARPNPFRPDSHYYVARPTFEGLMVGEKSEAQYLSEKAADTQASFQGDKAGMVEQFAEGFDSEKGKLAIVADVGQAYVVQANIGFVEPGYYAAVAASATIVRADVKIFDAQHQLIDEFQIQGQEAADLLHPSSGQRMRNAARQLGKLTGAYLKKRSGAN